mmetsp:Transcript_527/g.628  ORF Transcript_527/g.628 Transcript_527/m.628 type:complete len:472 (-) Transcript_527:177-1592(-)
MIEKTASKILLGARRGCVSLERRRNRYCLEKGKGNHAHRSSSSSMVKDQRGGHGHGHVRFPMNLPQHLLASCCSMVQTPVRMHREASSAWFSAATASINAPTEERTLCCDDGEVHDHHSDGGGPSATDGDLDVNSIHEHESEHTCREMCEDNYQTNNLPLPPPLPEPKFSFHRRVMPESLTQFSSPEGRVMFKESLTHGTSEAFFPLAEQFLNQSDPAYCGVTSLVMILNAIGIDPHLRWKGGWRWYADEMILETCCINAERVKRAGILMEEFQSLARCQGLTVEMKRPLIDDCERDNDIMCNELNGKKEGNNSRQDQENDELQGLDEFRKNIIHMVQNPPVFSEESTHQGGGFMVVSFARSSLGQTGEGHFSPVAAYHEGSDMCLVLDVARFKYAPYWVSVEDLYEATKPVDPMTGKSRGWFMMYPSPDLPGFKGMKAHDEAKRSAELIPLYSSQEKKHVCRVGSSEGKE